MTRDRLDPILQGICYANDYGKDSIIKAMELKCQLFPLGATMDNKTTLEAMYGIIHTALQIVEELEGVEFTVEEQKLKEIESE